MQPRGRIRADAKCLPAFGATRGGWWAGDHAAYARAAPRPEFQDAPDVWRKAVEIGAEYVLRLPDSESWL
ncbi:hypothetical protein AB0890_27375, partial [Streptomyces sp. NPDC005406]